MADFVGGQLGRGAHRNPLPGLCASVLHEDLGGEITLFAFSHPCIGLATHLALEVPAQVHSLCSNQSPHRAEVGIWDQISSYKPTEQLVKKQHYGSRAESNIILEKILAFRFSQVIEL